MSKPKPKLNPAVEFGEDYDWREAFACAGDSEGQHNSADVRPAPPLSDVSLKPFGREDVVKLLGTRVGDHDGPPWLAAGQLGDGRWFFLTAGCDYTGWDCQSGGHAFVAKTKAALLKYGMSDGEKYDLGIK